jgi:hypothetical protein
VWCVSRESHMSAWFKREFLFGRLARAMTINVTFQVPRKPTHSPPDVKTGRSTLPLAVLTALFGRVLVMLVAGLALFYGYSNDLT